MKKTYKVYPSIGKIGLVFSAVMAALGVMLILSASGLFPSMYNFLQNFHNELEFLNYKVSQGILGVLITLIFSRSLLKRIGKMFNKTPVLIADDFGLEINRPDNFNVIAWEYIDAVSIENYATSNSQRKRPTLIIRYRDENAKKQNAEVFIPISTLNDKPKNIISALKERNKPMKF